ncbi:hypothetical protein CVT24_005567 [Panaeolus cyanescens]|uniref:Uncharacterized protein n=1 Tax=Panaeolus cyanescens TaxID=181874 RepID=A0A409VQB1_9AGAR|nr:hypothetical protein CVT24_005567 [Panaeolus cyanescens]
MATSNGKNSALYVSNPTDTKACFSGSNPPSGPLCYLPANILSVIVDMVAELDKENQELCNENCDWEEESPNYFPSLFACSLAGCRSLMLICRKRIFRTVQLTSNEMSGEGEAGTVHNLLAISPGLAPLMRRLHWYIGESKDMVYPKIMSQFNKISTIAVFGATVDLTGMTKVNLVLGHFSTYPTLRTLAFGYTENLRIPHQLLREGSNLSTLHFENVSLVPFEVDPLDDEDTSTLPLEKLTLAHGVRGSDGLKQLLKYSRQLKSVNLTWHRGEFEHEHDRHRRQCDSDGPSPDALKLELQLLLETRFSTLQHLEIDLLTPKKDVFAGLGHKLAPFSESSTLQSLKLFIRYSIADDALCGPKSSWKALENAIIKIPCLKNLEIVINLYHPWREINYYAEDNCWKYYRKLRQLLRSPRIDFAFTVVLLIDSSFEQMSREDTVHTGPSHTTPGSHPNSAEDQDVEIQSSGEEDDEEDD